MTTPPLLPTAAAIPCPSCGAAATGRFCSSCGTALAGATCASCAAPLTTGARFCHRCGTPAGSTPAPRDLSGAIPWAVAGVALLCLIALVVGQQFGARSPGAADMSDGANGQGPTALSADAPSPPPPAGAMRAPDISRMTPTEQAERLYARIMTEHGAGREDAVRTFLPMATAAYERLAPLSLGQRYELGRIGAVGGDAALARAQSDTILQTRSTHLLGLILGAEAARMANDLSRATALDRRLRDAAPRERTSPLPEYLTHQSDVDAALAKVRSTP